MSGWKSSKLDVTEMVPRGSGTEKKILQFSFGLKNRNWTNSQINIKQTDIRKIRRNVLVK